MAMKHATRERQERFAKSFDDVLGLDWGSTIERLLSEEGLSWLTDEQMGQIASIIARRARSSQHRRLRNRAILRGAA